jgi:Ca2+-transporting ATPase
VPADCIIFGNNTVLANEASLTGEPEDLKKSQRGDCFLLSSSLLTEGEEVRALVIGIGSHSQWGKIKENLVVEAVNTPLQDKLEDMTKSVSMLAAFVSRRTFVRMRVG